MDDTLSGLIAGQVGELADYPGEDGVGTLPTLTPEGLPINPATGQRYGMVEPHPYTDGPRPGLCHLCNGRRNWTAHVPAGPAYVARAEIGR